jgi:hypothetical protein
MLMRTPGVCGCNQLERFSLLQAKGPEVGVPDGDRQNGEERGLPR